MNDSPDEGTAPAQDRTSFGSLAWLVSGLILGLLGVLVSVLIPSANTIGDEQVAAVVNGSAITREKYASYMELMSLDLKNPTGPEQARYVLQRMIEEELLIQRGLEVGLLDSDKRVRAAVVAAMIEMTTASAEARAPSDEDLTEFFAENLDYFMPTSRLRVRQLAIEGKGSEQAANEAYRRLVAGEKFEVVNLDFGTRVALTIPDTLLPPAKLREYLGPTLVQVLTDKSRGYVTEPEETPTGFRINQLVDVYTPAPPQLAEIREQVEAEYVRRAGDQALRDYLEWLKDRADIRYADELPFRSGGD